MLRKPQNSRNDQIASQVQVNGIQSNRYSQKIVMMPAQDQIRRYSRMHSLDTKIQIGNGSCSNCNGYQCKNGDKCETSV